MTASFNILLDAVVETFKKYLVYICIMYSYKLDIWHKYRRFGVISDELEELGVLFWASDLDFFCIYYMPNFCL